MNIHKNARLTLVRRIEMAGNVVEGRLTPAERSQVAGALLGRRQDRIAGSVLLSEPQSQKDQTGEGLGDRRAAAQPAAAAASAGFADQSHLTRVFVRHFGFTPGAWKTAITPAAPQ